MTHLVAIILWSILGTGSGRVPTAVSDESWTELQVIEPELSVSDWKLVDLDGDGPTELLVLGMRGEVRVWRRRPEADLLADEPIGTLVLSDPEHSAVGLWKAPDGKQRLGVIDPSGLRWFGLGESGAYEAEAVLGRQRRARFGLRIGRPRFLDILQDVDGDGAIDLVLPSGRSCELWLSEDRAPSGEVPGVPTFRRGPEVVLRIGRESSARTERLSDFLQASFVIPRLDLQDVNGDGRSDLLVQDGELRQFHLQGESDGLPAEPTVVLDLSIFRDTTPPATVRPGRTLAGSDSARLEIADLDGDEIPDYVIAHRRKVWVFHGSAVGPQFQKPTSILKVSDDVTALLLPHLDDDPWPDLFLLKVQVPTLATLILGLLTEWEVDITALGYASEEGKTFAKRPGWRGELSVTLPSIVTILKDPESIIQRFEQVGQRFQETRRGDFDGDRSSDRLLIAAEAGRLDLWRGAAESGDPAEAFESLLRRVFFEGEKSSWSLDEVLGLLEQLADERSARLTGGRPADASGNLRDPEAFAAIDFEIGDIDGDRRDELMVVYRERARGAILFELLRWERSNPGDR